MALIERYDTVVRANNQTSPSPADRASLLRRLLDHGDLRIQQLKVSRSAASRALGLSVDQLTSNPHLVAMLEAHDDRLVGDVEEKLSARLARDYAAGTLALHHGVISRERICASFHLASSTFDAQPRLRAILERYDRMIAIDYVPRRPFVDPNERKLAKWLEEGLHDGTLQPAAGKVSRLTVSRFLGMSPRALSASPRLISVIERYDEAIKASYVVAGERDRLERLRALLASKACPIHGAGTSIDQSKLGAAIGISPQKLMRPPYLQLVAEKNAALLDEAKSDAIDTTGRAWELLDGGQGARSGFGGPRTIVGNGSERQRRPGKEA